MDEDIEEGARRLMRAGFALILAGLATGFAVPVLEAPRMGLASHIQGLLNGMLLVILGLVWPRFGLGTRARRVAFWAALYGAVANWGVTFLSALWGAGRSMPIAAEGRTGTAFQEAVIDALLLSLSAAMLLAVGLAILGLSPARVQKAQDPGRPGGGAA